MIANIWYHDTLQYGPAVYTAAIVLNCNYLTMKQGNENIYLDNNILLKHFKNPKKGLFLGKIINKNSKKIFRKKKVDFFPSKSY